jgi:hypothetical protein
MACGNRPDTVRPRESLAMLGMMLRDTVKEFRPELISVFETAAPLRFS